MQESGVQRAERKGLRRAAGGKKRGERRGRRRETGEARGC